MSWLHRRALRSSSPDKRREAAEALAAKPDERAVPTLVELLEDPLSSVRYATARALLAASWSPDTRRQAVQLAIGGMPPIDPETRHGELLLQGLKSLSTEDYSQALAAAQALKRLADQRAIPPLQAWIDIKNPADLRIHLGMLEALASLDREAGVSRALELLELQLGDLAGHGERSLAQTCHLLDTLEAREPTAALLQRVGHEGSERMPLQQRMVSRRARELGARWWLERLLEAELDDEVLRSPGSDAWLDTVAAAVTALAARAAQGDHSQDEPLSQLGLLAREGSDAVALLAVATLAAHGDPSGVPELAPVVHNLSADVASAAAEALAALDPQAAVPLLVEALRGSVERDPVGPEAGSQIAEVLAELAEPGAMEPLVRWIEDGGRPLAAAARWIAVHGGPDRVDEVLEALSDHGHQETAHRVQHEALSVYLEQRHPRLAVEAGRLIGQLERCRPHEAAGPDHHPADEDNYRAFCLVQAELEKVLAAAIEVMEDKTLERIAALQDSYEFRFRASGWDWTEQSVSVVDLKLSASKELQIREEGALS